MRVVQETDPSLLFREAAHLLGALEADNSLVLGVLQAIERREYLGIAPWLLGVRDAQGGLHGLMVRTPPMPLLLSTMSEEALDALANYTLNRLPLPLQINGRSEVVDGLVTRVVRESAARPTTISRLRLFTLRQLQIKPSAPGHCRTATQDDLEPLAQWLDDFYAEALPNVSHSRRTLETARVYVQRGTALLWEDDGQVVAFACSSRRVGTGASVGPVYTLPEQRGRGYAAALTAALTQQLLDDGSLYACLFADLSNPASCRLYEKLGFAAVSEHKIVRLAIPTHSDSPAGPTRASQPQ